MSGCDTKLKADIAECAVLSRLLKQGFKCLKPVGDRLPYDLAIDLNGRLIRLQIKSAGRVKNHFIADTRRTKTNRRCMKRERYAKNDFAIRYIENFDTFYIMPIGVFCSYKSGIALVEEVTRQRQPRSYIYREAWNFLREVDTLSNVP